MTAIARQSAKIFAQNAPVGQVTAFRTTESTPQTTKAPDQIQNENYLQGWLNADGSGNVLPYAEDMNGLFYTLSYNTAYLYEKGIPEYSSTQTYYLNSFCQYGGNIYKCKGDSVINIAPTNTNYWDVLPSTSYTATTVGAATTNYGTVYAGTNTAGTQFQFKTIIGGSNVTITETNDSLTISSTGGGGGTAITASAPLDLTNNVLSIPAATSSQGGYLTAADWTSFNSKLSSTIFSSNNSWTGTNTFGTILPSSNTVTLGNSSNYWKTIFTSYITTDEYTSFLFKDARIENSRFKVGFNGVNLGIFPEMSATDGYDSYLGDSTYPWDNLYSVNATFSGTVSIHTLDSVETLVSPYNLGGNNSLIALSYNPPIMGGRVTQWGWLGYLSNSEIGIFPSTTNTGSLGSSSYKWNSSYITKIYTNDVYSNEEYLEIHGAASTNLRIIPTVTSGNYGYLGSTTDRWRNVYAETFNCGEYTSITSNNSGKGIAFTARNASDSGARYIFFYNDEFYPTTGSSVNLGSPTGGRWKKIYANDGNIDVSDRKAKENIELLEDKGLEKINDLTLYSYTLKGGGDHITYGFIAQDEIDTVPEVIEVPSNYKEDDETICLGVHTNNVLYLAVKAIQELSAKVDSLEQQLMELKK